MGFAFSSVVRAKFGVFALLLPVAFLTGCGGGSSSTPGANALRVACVGDSITFGTALSNREQNAYPVVLNRLLGKDYLVGNFGVPGATLCHDGRLPYQKQTAYTRALQFKPRIVIVLLGTNDSKGAFDSQHDGTFTKDYTDLIAAFKEANPNAKVYACLPIPSYPESRSANVMLSTRILPLIREVAGETKSQLIDLNTPFRAHPDLYSDSYHPNVAGARVLAEDVHNGMSSVLAP